MGSVCFLDKDPNLTPGKQNYLREKKIGSGRIRIEKPTIPARNSQLVKQNTFSTILVTSSSVPVTFSMVPDTFSTVPGTPYPMPEMSLSIPIMSSSATTTFPFSSVTSPSTPCTSLSVPKTYSATSTVVSSAMTNTVQGKPNSTVKTYKHKETVIQTEV